MNKFRTHFRRLVPLALFSAAVGLGAVGFPAVASAAGTWDIEAYDDCMAFKLPVKICCEDSGGVYGSDGVCRAPAAQTQGSRETSTPKPPTLGIPLVPVQPPLVG
jgi:hypothetical protein